MCQYQQLSVGYVDHALCESCIALWAVCGGKRWNLYIGSIPTSEYVNGSIQKTSGGSILLSCSACVWTSKSWRWNVQWIASPSFWMRMPHVVDSDLRCFCRNKYVPNCGFCSMKSRLNAYVFAHVLTSSQKFQWLRYATPNWQQVHVCTGTCLYG